MSDVDSCDADDGTQWGSGGMRTKIIAAKLAGATGVSTTLINGCYPERIMDVLAFAAENQSKDSGMIDYRKYPVRNARCRSRSNHAPCDDKEVDRRSDKDESPCSMKKERSILFDAVMQESHDDTFNGSHASPQPADKPEPARGLVTIERDQINSWPYQGTIFGAHLIEQSMKDQRRWILSLPSRGRIFVDEGCARSLIFKKKSLFAAGILAVEGNFHEGEAVDIYRGLSTYGSDIEQEAEIARALVNVSADTLRQVKGKRTADFTVELGSADVAHRSNICFVSVGPW